MKTSNKRNSRKSPRGDAMNLYSNPNEQIATITETCGRKTRTFYAIRDCAMNYWRGTSDLDDYDAWTRDLGKRAMFESLSDARRELMEIAEWRRENEERSLADYCIDNNITRAELERILATAAA